MEKNQFKKYYQDYFFEIIDQTTNGITITDPNKEDNPVIYVNQAFLDIFGYSYEESVGRNCRFLQQEDRDQKNLELVRKAVKDTKSITTVLRNYTKSGKLIYNEIRISPIFDKKTKKLKFFLGIQKELSSRNQLTSTFQKKLTKKDSYENLETALQELEIVQTELLAQNEELVEKDKRLEVLNHEFSSLFQDAPLAYVVIDKNLEIHRFNKIADKYFSFSKINRITKSLFSVTTKENIQQLISWISNEDYNENSLELNVLRVDKGERRFKLYGKKYMINENFLLISLIDITESYEIKKNLEERVQKGVEEKLEQEKFILKQAKLASMGEMIDAIAHQWLNPISIIRLYSQDSYYLLQENYEQNKNIILEHHEKIDIQIDHLVNTLEEFRSFYRPDTSSKSIGVNSLIESTLLLIKDELIKNSITYSITIKSEFDIKVIKNQFKHVLINLINNSKDAFVENKIKVKTINFELTQDEEYNIIRYSDNAGGIPTNIIDKIFEPNFTTKGKGKGTGVGLYLCKQILDKFNIELDVVNKNDGALFSIKSLR